MGITTALDVNRTVTVAVRHRVTSTLTGIALALAVVRYAAQRKYGPRREV